MIKVEEISRICESCLNNSEFIVDIKINNANDIFVYVDDLNGITIEACKRINRYIESQLDREVEDFSLEVGSPGLSKPFKVDKQYLKALNTNIEVVTKDGEKICGKLSAFNDNDIVITKTFKKKVNNKKQEVQEEYKIDKTNIKSTKSEISFSK
ncbi:MAG: ribosome assembly cofactor RimP [Bacteroidales bacterium]|nr:ribosome assembly cofactor RimP [Bacteroidales bacterium]